MRTLLQDFPVESGDFTICLYKDKSAGKMAKYTVAVEDRHGVRTVHISTNQRRAEQYCRRLKKEIDASKNHPFLDRMVYE